MSTPNLPTPRAFLTDLISTLSDIPPNPDTKNTANPLKNAPPEVRSLITTLHIILPHLLLPALDLLDRQLVTKVIQRPSQGLVDLTNVDFLEQNTCEKEVEKERENSFYMVQSSQSIGRQRRQKSYILRLYAWNCTCASFVFSAFPSETSNESTPCLSDEDFSLLRSLVHGDAEAEVGEKWEFGGASKDGKDDGSVPACKHLIAAVLADRWEALRVMMPLRVIGKEEMAGLAAGF